MDNKSIQNSPIPKLSVYPLNRVWELKFRYLIKNSGIKKLSPHIEVWTSEASSKALSYYSHGIFRYFGKFPPTIARYLINKYTKKNDLIIDPMCGSGTTCLEASLLNRRVKCYDVNPLAILISKVKITTLNKMRYLKSLDQLLKMIAKKSMKNSYPLIGLRNPEHWFLRETISSLSRIRKSIDELDASKNIKDAFLVAFLAIVRRVSKATTQQGRLFLDIATAEKNAIPFFRKKAEEISLATANIPQKHNIKVTEKSILDNGMKIGEKAQLIICHPPYFNSYKYSGVNSLELTWMGVNHADIRKKEVREAFKVGKAEKVSEYINDMSQGLSNLDHYLKDNGRLALMIGDTIIRGQYIPVTKMLLDKLKNTYKVEYSALRIPKFTEASWVASQRRKGHKLGINLCDIIIILKKK